MFSVGFDIYANEIKIVLQFNEKYVFSMENAEFAGNTWILVLATARRALSVRLQGATMQWSALWLMG